MSAKKYHILSVDAVAEEFDTTLSGLTKGEAVARLEQNGPNELPDGEKKTVVGIFLQQFKNVMIWVLIGAATISMIMGEITDAVIILLVVLLNSVMGTVQEARAEAALESLKSMAAPKSMVVRDGVASLIDSKELVIGDVVILEAGMSVGADIRITESATLSAIESALTGESEAVIKITEPIDDEMAVVGDMKNMCFLGTSISYGRGAGIVVAIGLDTQMGNIANKLATTEKEDTPLQKQINQISKVLSYGVIGIATVIFIVGMMTGREMMEMFFLAVSLAVAAIPEGLATVVTIVLAMGMKRMSQRGAIIRKLPAVETLGSTSIICSDKTGTLTMNKMTVERVYSDFAYDNTDKENEVYIQLVHCMALCNDSNLDENSVAIGDPTETALMEYSLSSGMYSEETLRSRTRSDEIPFDSVRKMMSVATADSDHTMYTKGAPDVLIDRCTHVLCSDGVVELDRKRKKEIIKANDDMGNDALRVLAFASKSMQSDSIEDKLNAENGMVFIGLCGEMDPPRIEAYDAVAKCKIAGIRPIMITGDHKITASAIANKLGILSPDKRAIEGRDIEQMTDQELADTVDDVSVYARVSPDHKVRIVDAWQSLHKIVAMTGDGVNDAPALKSSDIGVGMGITGTDVSKASSDMILTDDNFATIVKAVEEGRKIFINIKKAVKFLLSSNIGEVIALFIATMMGWSLFQPVHILWINLVTDSFPAIALGVEPAEGDVMKDKPRDSREPFFTKHMWMEILLHGAVEGAITLGVYIYARSSFDPAVATTMAFVTLGMTQLFHALGARFDLRSFFSAPFSNKAMILAFCGSMILQVSVVLIPPIREVFSLTALTGMQWTVAIGSSVLMLLFGEIEKIIKRAKIK